MLLIYIWDVLVMLFMESLIRTARTYSYFFLLYKWYKSDLQIVPLFQIILDLWAVLMLGGFSGEDIKEHHLKFLVTFLVAFPGL